MRVLVACEESQVVCKAFRARGHEAYSNDLLDCSGGHPEWHLKMDCFEAIKLMQWDLMIGHPPCTYVCAGSMNWINREEGRKEKMYDAVEFFKRLLEAPIEKIALENPIGRLNTLVRKPDQTIRAYQFGHIYKKDVCLWIKNLPKLEPTHIVPGPHKTFDFWSSHRLKTNGGNKKSVTFLGIARAMAEQWG